MSLTASTTLPRAPKLSAREPADSGSKKLRLPSDIKRAYQIQEEIREGRDSGTFGYRNRFFRLVGSTRRGTPTGYGVLYLADGGMVEGDFDHRGEISCDNGCRRWPDGTTYLGPLKDGEAHGVGEILSVDGDEYRGDFIAGYRNGCGVLRNRTRSLVYEGEFHNNLFHGNGRLTNESLVCEGTFCRGKPHGENVSMTWTSGDTYIGPAICGLPDTTQSDHEVLVTEALHDLVNASSKTRAPSRASSSSASRNIDVPATREVHLNTGTFYSALTGVTYVGPFCSGKRTDFPSHITVTEIYVNGSPDAIQTVQSIQEIRGSAARPPLAAGSKSHHRKPIEGQKNQSVSQTRHIDVLRKSADKFFTIALGKKLAIEVCMVRRVPFSRGAAELDTTETNRAVCLQVFKYPQGVHPDTLGQYFASNQLCSAVSFLEQRHDIAPPPSASNKARKPSNKLTPLSISVNPVTEGTVVPSTPDRPTNCTSTLCGKLQQTQTTSGKARFEIQLGDPGPFVLHFFVPDEANTYQVQPGCHTAIETLGRIQGFMALRVVRQC